MLNILRGCMEHNSREILPHGVDRSKLLLLESHRKETIVVRTKP